MSILAGCEVRESTTIISLVVVTMIGCGTSDSDQLIPKGGFNYAKVSYDPKPIVNPTVVAVPVIHLESYPNHSVNLELPSSLKRGAGLAIEGSLTFAKPRHRGGIIYLDFLKPSSDGEDQVVAATFLPLKVTGDVLKYRVEIHAPKSTGKYKVKLRMMHPPSTEGLFQIAVGEVEVQ